MGVVGYWGGERGRFKRGDIRIILIDSHCCMAESNLYYKAIFLQSKEYIFKKVHIKTQQESC